MILIDPQLLMLTGIGAMKSLTSAVNDAEERLLTKALPNASQVPGGKTFAFVRSIAVSPNCKAGTGLMWLGELGNSGSDTESRLLTAPIESVPSRVTWSPQHGNVLEEKQTLVAKPVTTGVVALVSQRCNPIVGLPPPLVKSKVTSRSPAVRTSVFAPVVVRSGWAFWLISKSMFAVPSELARSHARYRKLWLLT